MGGTTAFEELSSIPTPESAQFCHPNGNVLEVKFSTRDRTRDVKPSLIKYICLPSGVNAPSFLPEPEDIVFSCLSPSGTRMAVLRQAAHDDIPRRYVQIYADGYLEASHEVTDLHAKFCNIDQLRTLSFCPTETTLLYLAEANTPPVDGTPDDPYAHFRYKPDLGEGGGGHKRLTMFLFRWTPYSVGETYAQAALTSISALKIAGQDERMFLAEALFISDSKLIATAYRESEDGRFLGFRWCLNRPSQIWEIDLPSDFEYSSSAELTCTGRKLSDENLSCKSPRLHGDNLFWLSNPIGGAHASSSSLHSFNLITREEIVLVKPTWEPKHRNDFPGFYLVSSLPISPFLELDNGTYVVTHSFWRSRLAPLLICAQDGNVVDLTPIDELQQNSSWKVLCTDGKRTIVCARSTPISPAEIMVGVVENEKTVNWKSEFKPMISPILERRLSMVEYSVIDIPKRFPTEIVLLKQKRNDGQNAPCITRPHGGPHIVMTTEFSPYSLTFVLEGFTVALVNYTGSLGYGEKYVQELRGKCGTLDVMDCLASARHLIELGIADDDPRKHFIYGGSHGGFLAGHLIGQYPDFFSAAVLRNPVISVGEISNSDLPDWYYSEFGLEFEPGMTMTPTVFNDLYSVSPISHVDAVHARVLILVGGKDRRVAPSQALGYYHALKGRGKHVEMLYFPDEGHSLSGVEAERIEHRAIVDWFKKML